MSLLTTNKLIIPFFGEDPIRKRLFGVIWDYYLNWEDGMKYSNDYRFPETPNNRSGARNYLIRNCTERKDIIVILDSDVIVDLEALSRAVELVKSEEYKWALPYSSSGYYRLNEPSTEILIDKLNDNQSFDRPNQRDCIIGGFKSYASAIVMSREFFETCGGYDERFRGWSYEDDAFRDVALTLGGKPWRPNKECLIHLWHPEPISETWEQPFINYNKALYEQYKIHLNNRDGMIKHLEARNG